MKYNVGDVVKIKTDLVLGEDYGCDSFVSEMAEYKGKFAKIIEIDNGKYSIDLDNGEWHWTDEMFESDEDSERTVDIGYHLNYCGHQMIENVYYGGYAHDHDHVFCTTVDKKNQYTLPIENVDFIVPHIEK